VEQINLFMEKAQTDEGLAVRLKEMQVRNATVEELITLAAEHGFTVTKEDVEQPNRKVSGELSEEQLEEIVGGQQASGCFFRAGSGIALRKVDCRNFWRCHHFNPMCICYDTNRCQYGEHRGICN